jgi:hypothetical protein
MTIIKFVGTIKSSSSSSWNNCLWKANGSLACQEINYGGGNYTAMNIQVAFYPVHKIPPLNPVENQLNQPHILTPYFFKIHLNIFSLSTPKFCKIFPYAPIISSSFTLLPFVLWSVHIIKFLIT